MEKEDVDMIDLNDVGAKINNVVVYCKDYITNAEIDAFLEYIDRQETIAPLLQPSEFMAMGGSSAMEKARDRANAIKQIIELEKEE